MQFEGTVYIHRQRSPRFSRIAHPPPLRLTERDRAIVRVINEYRILRRDQIQTLFFPSLRTTNAVLSRLYQHAFLERLPPLLTWGRGDSPVLYTLGTKGRDLLGNAAGKVSGRAATALKTASRYFLEHTLAINNVRVAFSVAAARAKYPLEQWITEAEFRSAPDRISFPDSGGTARPRPILPDAACVIRGPGYTSRLLLEIDMGTEDNQRFVREKVRPGIAYLRSAAYKRRFGFQSGRWLIVTTSQQRLLNLKWQTESAVSRAAAVFHFTTFAQVTPATILTEPIWLRGGDTSPRPLLRL